MNVLFEGKRGRKPLSDEVKLQRAEEKKKTKKKYLKKRMTNYIRLLLNHFSFILTFNPFNLIFNIN